MGCTGASARPARIQRPPGTPPCRPRPPSNRAGQRPRFQPHLAMSLADEHGQAPRRDHRFAPVAPRTRARRRPPRAHFRIRIDRSAARLRSRPRNRVASRPAENTASPPAEARRRRAVDLGSHGAGDDIRPRDQLDVDGGQPRSRRRDADGGAHCRDHERGESRRTRTAGARVATQPSITYPWPRRVWITFEPTLRRSEAMKTSTTFEKVSSRSS